MSSTTFGGKILLEPVEEEKHEDKYGYDSYPFKKPTVYLEGVVEEYYPQTMFSWADDSVMVVEENRVIKYTKSSFTELLAKDEKGDIVWMDGRSAPYSGCWDGEYLNEERHGEEFTIQTYDLNTMKKHYYKAVLQKEEHMDNDDIRRISEYIETKEVEERFVIENGVLAKCNAREDHIVIPDGVTSIYMFAFSDRENTKSITLPKTLDKVDDWDDPFRYCKSLENVYVDKDNPKYYSINGSLIDRSTKTLVWANADFEIPNDGSIKRIGKNAFKGRKITNIKIPSSVVAIEAGAFQNCESLVSIDIPSSALEIGANAFYGCKSLKSIVIPELIKELKSCFDGCHSLESVTLPSSLTEIDYSAFSGCKSLKSIEIPSSVTKIGTYAFNGCSGLTEIKLPVSVTTIGEYAFAGCENLVSIELQQGIRELGKGAFSGCEALTDIKIPSSVLEIGSWCFSNCKSLTKLDIPNSVVEIGEYAFGWCETLTSLKLSSSLFKIPNDMCLCCKKLDNVVIPSSVYKIDRDAFSACSSLENIETPDTVKIIDKSAFGGCKFTSGGDEAPSDCPWGTDLPF